MVPGVPSDAVVMKPAAAAAAGASVCSNCKSDDRWILHNVHHNNKIFRLLCTSCVLKLHSAAFCPFCFSIHPLRKSAFPSAPSVPDHRGCLICFKCKSASHSSCVAPNTPKSPYLCPTCLSPSSKLFDLCKPNSTKAATQNQSIDLRSAKALRAAAMIASNSLHEATSQARLDAERKAKEAVSARKRSKDLLERVAHLWSEVQREGGGEAVPFPGLVSNQNGFSVFKPKNSVAGQAAEKKESFNNGALVERKDGLGVNKAINGLPSGSQHLQKNK